MTQTTEKAFEAYVEQILLAKGWQQGQVSEWDKERAFFPQAITDFIAETQPELWETMRGQHSEQLESMLIDALVKELAIKGSLYVLRHGFKFYGKTFRLAYFKPAHGLNDEILAQYQANRLTVIRQVPCHPGDGSTVDLVFAINGLPVATCELKNPGTGQNYRSAIKQYKKDRNSGAPLFKFKQRALVHFAADPDEVYMTTRLAGSKTFFLPFNRGSHPGEVQCGAGNPQHPSGYRSGYFWEEVLECESFLDILGHFIFIEKKEEKVDDGKGNSQLKTKETMIFPRFHQLDATRKLITAARSEGAGQRYLIQHSAGSGKTNSISWLSHRLASLHNEQDHKIFDCVVVITDRQVLDRQLQDAIYQIEHAQGVVRAIDQDSKQLAEALVDGTKIVVTTLQKFPFVLRGLLHIAGAENVDEPDEEAQAQADVWKAEISKRRYAIIVDEAHSSQTGETARQLKELLGASGSDNDDEEQADWQDRLNQVMASRGHQPDLSFFAYTATPKGKTLELFGRDGNDGKPKPFHLYSMRQAIEEGFILDVLQNYTTYKTYFNLIKKAEDDPNLPKKKATRVLTKYLLLHPTNISQKIEVIVEHFRSYVLSCLGRRAKAMVVTSSRLHVVKYMEEFQQYIKEKGYADVRPLVAFSGTVRDPNTGKEYAESNMNIDVGGEKISEKQLPERFASPDYQVLLVADKYQTGFDQPLLVAMYVDKRLDGVQAVQTLSRLNRMFQGKDTTFVLDFVNDAENIYKAFKPYYDATSLQEKSDPARLEQLKHELDAFQVYHWDEVVAFAGIFYRPSDKQNPGDHARMQEQLQPAVDRFKAMQTAEQRDEFRTKLDGYVRVYRFLSQIIPYRDESLEMLYSYGRFLLPHLPREKDINIPDLSDEVNLQYYRLQRVSSGDIEVEKDDGKEHSVKSPTDVGSGRVEDEKKLLSEIIATLNLHFGTEFTEEDRLFLEQIKEKAVNDSEVIQLGQANPLDKFQLDFRQALKDLMIQRMNENDKIVSRYMDDREFQNATFGMLSEVIYKEITAENKR